MSEELLGGLAGLAGSLFVISILFLGYWLG
jgi:hypothetical protein